MSVLTPEPLDEEYLGVVVRAASLRGGLAGLTLKAHVAYRCSASEFHQSTFRRRVLEEMEFADVDGETLAIELGGYQGGTLRNYLSGRRDYGQDLLFALERWLQDRDRDNPFSPFSEGVIEAARAQG
jgi:hypothetical protein